MESQKHNLSADEREAIAVGYEPRDIHLRGVLIFGVALICICAAVLGVTWVLLSFLTYKDRLSDPVVSPVAIDRPAVAVPLQPSSQHNTLDREDLDVMRKQTSLILGSSGTTNTGRKTISIDEAMDRVIPLLPTKPGPNTAP